MKTKTISIVSVALLSLPGVLWSMEESPASDARPRGGAETTQPAEQMDVRVYHLQSARAREVVEILMNVTPGKEVVASADDRTNSLVVTAPPALMDTITALITALDKASPPTQMMCRVYMLELPSEHLGLRPFSVVVTGSAQLPPERVLNPGIGNKMQIERFRQLPTGDGQWQFNIAGRAASNEAIKNLTENISDYQVMELEWGNEEPIMLTTRVAPLPKSLQVHVQKFLGEGVGIVGYWFGNLSVPGRVEAPIGPWGFELSVDRSEQGGEVELEISVARELQDDPTQSRRILFNSMRCKVDRPVIIGYNRNNRGVHTMGAMVILPEPDTIAASK